MRHGSAVAQRSPRRESGGLIHSDRRERAQLLRTAFMGGDAEPCPPAHSSSGFRRRIDAVVEGIDGAERKPDTRPDRATVLAGRELRSLSAEPEANRADFGLHRGQSGFGGFGPLCGRVAVVQRRMAGGEPFGPACPTRLRKFLRSGGGMLAGGWWRRRNRRAPVHVYDSHLGRLVLHISPGLHHRHVAQFSDCWRLERRRLHLAPCGRGDPDQPVRRYRVAVAGSYVLAAEISYKFG